MDRKAKNYELTENRIIPEGTLKSMLKNMLPFVEKAMRDGTNLHHINDFYLIQLASLTGMRISEIAAIKMADISENNIVVIGKGSKKRNVPIGSRGKRTLKEFISIKQNILMQGVNAEGYLFLNRLGKPFDRFSINKRFQHWVKRCGIAEDYTFHSLRHFFATYLINNGFNLSEVQRILGHSSVSTCGIYLHFTKGTQDRVNAYL